MILRLVYSFLFLSLVTGNQRKDNLKTSARTGPCANEVCVCQDEMESLSNRFSSSPSSSPYPNIHKSDYQEPLDYDYYSDEESHYGLPQKGRHYPRTLSGSVPPKVESKNYDVEYVSDDSPVPRPVQIVNDETYTEKTICFTPSMVHRMVKAALEYVSQIPSESVGNIIDKIDQELNKMSDSDSPEEQYARKPMYPLDSKNIFKMLDKPRTESRTNLILQYEMPGAQEPQCREALEKLIEIAYNAYLELEQQPQCREYLYKFATEHATEDRPSGHLEYGPDLKSVIATILEEIELNKAKHSPEYPHADFYSQLNGYEVPSIPELSIPQLHEIVKPQIPQIHDINIPQIHEINSPQYHDITEIREIKIPQLHEIKVPQLHEINVPQYHDITEIHDIKLPKIKVPQIHDINYPNYHDRTEILDIKIPNNHDVPQIHEINIPQYHDITEVHDIKLPKLKIPQIHDLNIPQYHDITEIRDIKIPQIHDIKIPQIHDINHGQYHDRTELLDIKIPNSHDKKSPIHDLKIPQIHEINIPQYHDITEVHDMKLPKIKIPQIHDINIPQYHDITEIRDIKIPQLHDIKIPQLHDIKIPQLHDIKIPQLHDIKIPQIHDIKIPQIHDINRPQYHDRTDILDVKVPNIHDIKIPQISDLNIPQYHDITKIREYSIPQIKELPQLLEYNLPQIHEYVDETVQTRPLQPEETFKVILEILQDDDTSDLFDRLMQVIKDNRHNFHPKVYEVLITLLTVRKERHVPRFYDLILFLIDSVRNKQWPWSENLTEHILNYLVPDRTGHLDAKVVDIILNLYNRPTSETQIEFVLSLLKPVKEGNLDSKTYEIIIKLIKSYQNDLLRPEQIEKILNILSPHSDNIREIEIIDGLVKYKELGITPAQLDIILKLLKPGANGPQNIDFVLFLLKEVKPTMPFLFGEIISFLITDNGILDKRRHSLLLVIINEYTKNPENAERLLNLLSDSTLLDSRFIDILLLLDSYRQLSPELLETLLNLLSEELNNQLSDYRVKTLITQLAPLKQTHPTLVVDILSLLSQGGYQGPGSIVEWLENVNGPLNHDDAYANLQALLEKVENLKDRLIHDNLGPDNEFRTTDGAYTAPISPDNDFFVIFKWLESQGLLNPDQGGANNDLVNKLLKILEMGERELGVVELTYMLKHEKPLVYQPVYYVKYRLPILSFISNMKSLLVENPHLTADPLKLLQELIIVSNVTEVSPNLQGYPKDEILKLTFNDGDLVQAKILDEQNLNLNEQITYVHGLNADISPEEILQLNQMNEAKYYPNVLHIKESFPDKLTVHEINKYVDYPPVHYQRTKEALEADPTVPAPTLTPYDKSTDDKASQPKTTKA